MQIQYFHLLRDAELSNCLVEDSVGEVDGNVCPGGAGQQQGGHQPAQLQHPGAGRGRGTGAGTTAAQSGISCCQLTLYNRAMYDLYQLTVST